MNQQVVDILDFWRDNSAYWFEKSDSFDRAFSTRFEALHWQASRRELDHWAAQNDSALALILLLDQYPRNSFRNSPHMYATDSLARFYAHQLVAREGDLQLALELRVFAYLPFTHSECLADQDLAVALNTRGDTREGLRFAIHHREIVQRFGRFPHRNHLLGRDSTAEEIRFLEEGGFTG